MIHCSAFLFQSIKLKNSVLIAQHISFCFLAAHRTQEKRESEANTKKHVFTRGIWLYVILSKKKIFCHSVSRTSVLRQSVRLSCHGLQPERNGIMSSEWSQKIRNFFLLCLVLSFQFYLFPFVFYFRLSEFSHPFTCILFRMIGYSGMLNEISI
jgi:hypothetical protein